MRASALGLACCSPVAAPHPLPPSLPTTRYQARLPSPKPLTKATLSGKEDDAKPAIAAIVALFAASKSAPFAAVALAATEEELGATGEAYGAYMKEPAAKAAEKRAARSLAAAFKLASKSPTTDEILVSLRSTLVSLTSL